MTSASVRTRPWHAGAPGLSRPPFTLKEASKTQRKLQKGFSILVIANTHTGLHGVRGFSILIVAKHI